MTESSIEDDCGVCSVPCDYPLCFDCLGKLRKIIIGIKDIVNELQIQVTRQDVGAPSVGSSSNYYEPGVSFDIDASHSAKAVSDVLSRWFSPTGKHSVEILSHGPVRDRLLAFWHIQNYVRTGRMETGPEMYRQMEQVLKQAESVIDRKPNKIWIGDCDCGRCLRSFPDEKTLVCTCGISWNVADCRAKLVSLGSEQVVSCRDAEDLGEVFGAKISQHTVRSWRRRRKLDCVVCVQENATCNTHLYRFGDILELHKQGQKQTSSFVDTEPS